MVETEVKHHRIHQSFSTSDCTYYSKDNCVIYSPITNETILCKKDVLDLLVRIESLNEPDRTLDQFTQQNSEYGFNVVKQLVTMKILVESNTS